MLYQNYSQYGADEITGEGISIDYATNGILEKNDA